MNVVQSFAAEDETQEIFEGLTDEHQRSFVDAVTYADMFGPVIDFCWGFGAMMLYLVGIRFLGFEKVSVGLLVAFGTYINMFWNPIMNLSNFYNNLVTNLTAAERIFDILDTEPDITDADDVEELPEVKGEVTFSHVGFTYDRGTPAETKVLEDVNFVVKPGETIALVGPTGAGKTTIVNLISRFYDIEDGKILVDGYDLTKVSIESLRRQMGVMTQDNFIFHGTVLRAGCGNCGVGNHRKIIPNIAPLMTAPMHMAREIEVFSLIPTAIGASAEIVPTLVPMDMTENSR